MPSVTLQECHHWCGSRAYSRLLKESLSHCNRWHDVLAMLNTTCCSRIGSAKTDPVGFKGGFREGHLKDKFALLEASKNPIPKRRKLLAKRPFLQAKTALFETSFKLSRVSFSTPDRRAFYNCTLLPEAPHACPCVGSFAQNTPLFAWPPLQNVVVKCFFVQFLWR